MGRTPWSAPDAIVRLFGLCSEEADQGSAADEGVRPTAQALFDVGVDASAAQA